MFGPVPGRIVQEAMAPPKGGVLVDLATTGCLAQANALNQEFRIAGPLFALAQMRQCRAGQGVEGSAAILATVALEAVTLTPGVPPRRYSGGTPLAQVAAPQSVTPGLTLDPSTAEPVASAAPT